MLYFENKKNIYIRYPTKEILRYLIKLWLEVLMIQKTWFKWLCKNGVHVIYRAFEQYKIKDYQV